MRSSNWIACRECVPCSWPSVVRRYSLIGLCTLSCPALPALSRPQSTMYFFRLSASTESRQGLWSDTAIFATKAPPTNDSDNGQVRVSPQHHPPHISTVSQYPHQRTHIEIPSPQRRRLCQLQCSACTYLNQPHATRCDICTTPLPDSHSTSNSDSRSSDSNISISSIPRGNSGPAPAPHAFSTLGLEDKTRIAQLPCGHVECWDPTSQVCPNDLHDCVSMQ